MNLKVRRPQARRFGRAGESVTRGDRRKRERMFGRPFPPLTARPKQRREDVLGLTVGASPLGGAPKDHKNRSEILTPVGHPFITHPARRFAPITVRQDWKAVRQELEQVSDSVGIRTSAMRSMNISPTINMNAIIRDSTMSSPSPASNPVLATGPFENPNGWAACSISTSALPDPLPLPQPFQPSAHAFAADWSSSVVTAL